MHVLNSVIYTYSTHISQTHVQGHVYGMFQDEKYFPEPEKFRPERWTKGTAMKQEVKAMSNLVWGHGARMCIGKSLWRLFFSSITLFESIEVIVEYLSQNT